MKTFTLFFASLICFINYSFSQVDPNNDPDWDWLAEPVWILYHQEFNVYVQTLNPLS